MNQSLNPHTGGIPVPKMLQERTRQRILAYAQANYKARYTSLDIRFRGSLCYIDAYTEPNLAPGWPPKGYDETREQMIERLRKTPTHLCRLRYFGHENQWSLAFFTYSNEKYSPCMFHTGTFFGSPEEAFDIGATYLQEQ